MKTFRGLTLDNEDERRGVQKYLDWVEEKRLASRLDPLRAQAGRIVPDGDPETLEQVVRRLYAEQMRQAALSRPRKTR